MSQRRTLILVAAIAIAMVAAFLVYNYVDGVKEDAMGDAKLVPVFTVERQISRGASGEAAAEGIKQTNIPQQFKPANAITSLDDIAGRVAISDLAPNTVVVADMFVERSDPAARKSYTEYIRKIRDEDQTAITIEVSRVRGVASLIEPGDYVNVMLTNIKSGVDAQGNPLPEGEEPILFDKSARYLYQKAEVLAVDTTFVAQAGQSAEAATQETAQARGLITLIVPTKAAQYIASVEPERIYLTLVAPGYEPVPQTPIDPTDLIPAEDPTKLTPYGADGPDNAG